MRNFSRDVACYVDALTLSEGINKKIDNISSRVTKVMRFFVSHKGSRDFNLKERKD
jgi:hypothetical protein